MFAKMNVDYVDHMGSDLSVVDAARVSFDKTSEMKPWVDTYADFSDKRHAANEKGKTLSREEVYDAFAFKQRNEDGLLLSYEDFCLLGYLAEHNHWSPFSHAFLSFRIKAPIFVARQMVKHQVGLAWNEVSRRYVDSDPEFYEVPGWRGRAKNVKQGSASDRVNLKFTPAPVILSDTGYPVHPQNADIDYPKLCDLSIRRYKDMLDQGVAPEMARMVLPQSMMTEWIWSGSLYAFARVANLRLDSHAQAETRVVAERISEEAGRLFPASWEQLVLKNLGDTNG